MNLLTSIDDFSKQLKDGLKMRFSKLSDKTLLISYQEARQLQISPDFMKMLEKEIYDRGLPLPKDFNNQIMKIN